MLGKHEHWYTIHVPSDQNTLTFAVGAALAGAGGVLYAIAFPQIWTFMGIMPGLKAFIAAVLGGIGSVPGAMLGGLLLARSVLLYARSPHMIPA